jgi:hypothetical protein
MRKTEFMLDDKFEVAGEWWLPETQTERLFGTLRYSPSEIELEVSGTFEDVSLSDQLAGSSKFKDHACIFGLTHDRQRFTLLRAHAISLSTTTKYSAFHVVADKHVPGLGDFKLREVSFYCRHLDVFIARGLFAVNTEGQKEDFKSLTVQYVQPPKIGWRIEEIGSSLAIQTSLNCSSSPYEQWHKLHARSFVTITPDSPQNLDWFIRQIWRFCYLLTLVTDEVVSPTGVELFLVDDKYPGWHLYKSAKGRDDDEHVTPVFLFHLGHLLDNFGRMLNTWYSVSETMLDAIHLTMDAQRNPEHSNQGRFLLLAHAIEVVSRAITSSEYMNPADYETVKSKMKAAIPENVVRAHRDSLKKKIDYGNEYSFHKRVKMLIQSLSPAAQEIVCRDPTAFSRGISDTRNYYTHFTDELRAKTLSPVAMYWASEKLSFLMRIVLFRYLGIDEEVIVKQMKGHHRLLQRIFYSKEHPECTSKS